MPATSSLLPPNPIRAALVAIVCWALLASGCAPASFAAEIVVAEGGLEEPVLELRRPLAGRER